ncbi:Ribosomal lysine N-methyltransferase set10 [Pleurostoma richardsiae]|uniref:Ribosomal lysine N-methyltransferase set10 n=1 Tax=Pleurostoma richardsiae TaxID=41990 RepID=A0AA38RJH8_9PEZI|nr:Ribosomal lysine N-methyltransferase set10 [Pleurostoma richardsiae]
MKSLDQERFAELLSWAKRLGSGLDPNVEVYDDAVTRFSLRVKEGGHHLSPGDAVMTCHMATSFSFINALLGAPLTSHRTEINEPDDTRRFPSEFINSVPPHVVGRFYLMKQYLQGKESFWWPYIRTLPQPENVQSWSLPVFWPDDDASFLEGTNAGVATEEMQSNLKREFKHARRLLKDLDVRGWQDYTRLLYNWSFSIFTSRSFRPSLVLSEQVQDIVLPLLPPGCRLDDFSILLPVFDLANHSLTSRIQWDLSSQPEGCRLVTHDAYSPGAQVYNNYGRKTNGELLLAYGFVLPETEELHNDYFHLRKRVDTASTPSEAPSAASAAGGSSAGPPRDFLVSLRPINAPSSLVGRARQCVARDPDFRIRPEFSHVEDSLIWDLCTMGLAAEEKDQLLDTAVPPDTPLGPSASALPEVSNSETALRQQREHECLRRILSGASDGVEGMAAVVQKVKDILLAKLGYEYDKLCETDPVGTGEDGEEVQIEPVNENQALALLYRTQCRKVLENAIGSLVPGWQDEVGGG